MVSGSCRVESNAVLDKQYREGSIRSVMNAVGLSWQVNWSKGDSVTISNMLATRGEFPFIEVNKGVIRCPKVMQIHKSDAYSFLN